MKKKKTLKEKHQSDWNKDWKKLDICDIKSISFIITNSSKYYELSRV